MDSESGEAHVKNTYVNCDTASVAPRKRLPLPSPAVPPLAGPEHLGPGQAR
ncbi:hypothetical protein [Myxococcus vastator]|uniref:hypothetical protein n=1 Tax=Myxococcus vastator TaxID=2709664 RepID=UPI0013D0B9B4|nr:hypothetical protein [Myxococcus vastator]